jgi:ribosomal protein S18 acetylase RimI-like enzyme
MVYTCKVIEADSGESKLIKHYGYFEDNKQIAKCAMKLYSRGDNAGSYLLMNVEIKPSHRGKGLCGKFLRCVLKRYSGKTILLEVLINNIPAVKCYEGMGFVETKRGTTTLTMRKN